MSKSAFYSSARRVECMDFSPVRKVLDRAKELERTGRSIVHFEIGEPDFNTPGDIINATITAMKNNMTHYGPNRGLPVLRKAICKKLAEDNQLDYDPDEEIIVTVGAAEAVLNTILAFIDEEDEVIVFTPAFMNYRNLIKMAGGKVVPIPLREENGFQINASEVRAAITPKTRMILVNNPHNPTGTVFSEDVLREIANIAVENDLLVLSDEIYERIVYDGAKSVSMASFDGMKKRTITINGFSKSHAMTGWRLGYLAADKKLIPPILKLHQYVTTCAPTFLQSGVADAMETEKCKQDIELMVKTFASRRRLLLDGLSGIDGLTITEPKGAFYVFVNVSGTGLNGEEFATRLLENNGVALVPGVGFDSTFVDYVRISYATSESQIQEGLKRMKEFVENL